MGAGDCAHALSGAIARTSPIEAARRRVRVMAATLPQRRGDGLEPVGVGGTCSPGPPARTVSTFLWIAPSGRKHCRQRRTFGRGRKEAIIPERVDSIQPERWPQPTLPPPAIRQTESRATAALVFGVLGLTVLPFIGSPIAVVLALNARRRIASSRGRLNGKGLADAGLALGLVGLLITLYFVYIIYDRILSPPSHIPPGFAG